MHVKYFMNLDETKYTLKKTWFIYLTSYNIDKHVLGQN